MRYNVNGDFMNFFSIAHLIYIIICILICLAFYYIFRNKSEKVKYIATFIPSLLALIVHFLKLLIPEYRNTLPDSLLAITPETICATSTLIFPFIYISKNKALKDYMAIVGILSGFLTIIIPGDIIGYSPFNIEVMRFFFAHLMILITPLFMLIFKIHTLTKKWIKHTLITFFIILAIVALDNLTYIYIKGGKQGVEDYINSLNP